MPISHGREDILEEVTFKVHTYKKEVKLYYQDCVCLADRAQCVLECNFLKMNECICNRMLEGNFSASLSKNQEQIDCVQTQECIMFI